MGSVSVVSFRVHNEALPVPDFVRDYWSVGADGKWAVSVEDLAEKNRMSVHILREKLKKIAYGTLPQYTCACGYARHINMRTNWRQLKATKPARVWECNRCRDSRRGKEQERVSSSAGHLQRMVVTAIQRFRPESLNLTKSLYLAALSRNTMHLRAMEPPSETPVGGVCCDHSQTSILIKYLLNNGLVTPRLDVSNEGSFSVSESGVVRFEELDVGYTIPVKGEADEALVINHITELAGSLKDRLWEDQCSRDELAQLYGVVMRALRWECLAYVRHQLRKNELEWDINDNAWQEVLTEALTQFSLGQMYYFMYGAVKYTKGTRSKTPGPVVLLAMMKANIRRAQAGGWDIDPYGRVKQIPYAGYSYAVFTWLLGLGDPLNLVLREHPLLSRLMPTEKNEGEEHEVTEEEQY